MKITSMLVILMSVYVSNAYAGGGTPSSSVDLPLYTAEGEDIEDCVESLIYQVLFRAPVKRTTVNGERIYPVNNLILPTIRGIEEASDGYIFRATVRGNLFDETYDVDGWLRLQESWEIERFSGSDFRGYQSGIGCSIKLDPNSSTELINLSLRNSNDEVILVLGQGMGSNK